MRRLPLAVGPAALLITLATPPPGALTAASWHTAGLATWMAVWWLTAVVPLEATALLPIVVLPLVEVASIGDVTRSYADPVIFLFLGGFLLAATLERWELHTRFALAAVRTVGTDAPKVVLAFLLASAALSMWISNTATAVMMLPIAAAVAGGRAGGAGGPEIGRQAPPVAAAAPAASPSPGFPTALMLAVAYGASIGGVATLIGTPPNAILAAAAQDLLGREVSFGAWLGVGLSTAIPMLGVCWLVLVRMFHVRGPVGGLAEAVRRQAAALGRLGGGERFVVVVFTFTALSWILREPKELGPVRVPGLSDLVPGISDPAIAIAAALVLLVTPLPRARFATALDWRTAAGVPWGILLLFGGGLALAGAFETSGLTAWIAGRLAALHGAPFIVVLAAVALLFVALTELTSNTATAALGMPLLAGVAQGVGVPPLPLMATGALAASMAFMLPVATPPNAIVYASGTIRPGDMARAGVALNGAAVVIITMTIAVWRL